MDLRILAKSIGGLLILFGNTLLIPAFFSLYDDGQFTEIFFETAAFSIALGVVLWGLLRNYHAEVLSRTGFAIVTVAWLSATFVGALPYYASAATPTFIDAFFESVSGFTGTGATVIIDVEALDRALLLWRSLTHWLGGLGIILFFLAILPLLGIKGVQLFRAEAAGPQKDRITPRVQETAKRIWVIYLGFTVLTGLALHWAGMDWFDAVNHAMAAIATGGFSTKNSGVAFFQSAAIDYVLVISMLLASINFSLYYRLFAQRDLSVFGDTELRWYLRLTVGAIAVCVLLNAGIEYTSLSENVRMSVFSIVATASTTGFSNADYVQWGHTTHLLIILLMVTGGMSGSTAGGLKVIRLVAAVKLMSKELRQVIHRNALYTVKTNGRSVPEGVLNAIWGYIFLYLLVFTIVAAVMTLGGSNIVESVSGTFAALSNIGPGLGALGPTGNYAALPPLSKVALTAGMLLGRLEFYTVLVLFTPAFWRR